jgi:hypothetical protein
MSKWSGCVSTFHYVKHCILANFEQTSDLAVKVAGGR